MGMARTWSDEENQGRFPESLPGQRPKPARPQLRQPAFGFTGHGPMGPVAQAPGFMGHPSRSHYHASQVQESRSEIAGIQGQNLAKARAVPGMFAQFSKPETLPPSIPPVALQPAIASGAIHPMAAFNNPPPTKPAKQAAGDGAHQQPEGQQEQQAQQQQQKQFVHPGVAMQQQGLQSYNDAISATNKAWEREMDSRVAQANDQADREHEANIARMALQSKQEEQRAGMAMAQQAAQQKNQRNSMLMKAAGLGGTTIVNGRKSEGFSPFRQALLG